MFRKVFPLYISLSGCYTVSPANRQSCLPQGHKFHSRCGYPRQPLLEEIQLIVMICSWLWCLFNLSSGARRNALRTERRKVERRTDKVIKIEEEKVLFGSETKLFPKQPQTELRSRFSLKGIIEKRFFSHPRNVISYDLDRRRKTIKRI